MITEPIEWRAPAEAMPDDESTVLLKLADADGEPVWPGYCLDGQWYLADGMPTGGVQMWAQMPAGRAAPARAAGPPTEHEGR